MNTYLFTSVSYTQINTLVVFVSEIHESTAYVSWIQIVCSSDRIHRYVCVISSCVLLVIFYNKYIVVVVLYYSHVDFVLTSILFYIVN